MKFLSGIYGWIAAAVVAVLGAAGIYLKGRSAGKKAEEAKQVQSDLQAEKAKNETLEKVNDVTTEISGLPDADAERRLRDKYTRD